MIVLGVTVTETIPDNFTLYSVYPNPFNLETTISFDLPEAQQLTVAIYDLTGREVIPLRTGNIQPGGIRLSGTPVVLVRVSKFTI